MLRSLRAAAARSLCHAWHSVQCSSVQCSAVQCSAVRCFHKLKESFHAKWGRHVVIVCVCVSVGVCGGGGCAPVRVCMLAI